MMVYPFCKNLRSCLLELIALWISRCYSGFRKKIFAERSSNVIRYNPPFSRNVATNVGRSFLKILDEEFPTNHMLHKIFNRSTIKIINYIFHA